MSHCYVLLQPAGYIGLCGWKGFPVLKQHHPKNKLAHAAGPWWGLHRAAARTAASHIATACLTRSFFPGLHLQAAPLFWQCLACWQRQLGHLSEHVTRPEGNKLPAACCCRWRVKVTSFGAALAACATWLGPLILQRFLYSTASLAGQLAVHGGQGDEEGLWGRGAAHGAEKRSLWLRFAASRSARTLPLNIQQPSAPAHSYRSWIHSHHPPAARSWGSSSP